MSYYKDIILKVPVKKGLVMCLFGDLGAGKTTFVQEFVNFLNLPDNIEVTSPTFNILNTYNTKAGKIWHYDLYRIKSYYELEELALEDALDEIVLIEWPEIALEVLPSNRVEIYFELVGEERKVKVLYRNNSPLI